MLIRDRLPCPTPHYWIGARYDTPPPPSHCATIPVRGETKMTTLYLTTPLKPFFIGAILSDRQVHHATVAGSDSDDNGKNPASHYALYGRGRLTMKVLWIVLGVIGGVVVLLIIMALVMPVSSGGSSSGLLPRRISQTLFAIAADRTTPARTASCHLPSSQKGLPSPTMSRSRLWMFGSSSVEPSLRAIGALSLTSTCFRFESI